MDHWRTDKLVNLTEKIGSGATPKGGKQAYKKSGISLVRSMNVHDSYFKYKDLAFIDGEQAEKLSNVEVQKGDVLLNITGASVARCCLIPPEILPARVNQHVMIIRPKKTLINSKFLSYLLVSKDYKTQLLETGEQAGTTRQAITKSQIQDFKIKFPPLEEQKRIVKILDESFEAIALVEANTKRNLAIARELFDSYLNKILLKFVQEKSTQTLNCITDLIVDCEHKTAPTQETGFPSIRTPNIGKGHLILENVYRVSEETYEQWTRRAKPKSGDLILAREAPAGNVGVIPENEKVCLGQRTVLIRPKKNINSQYLAFFLLHPQMQTRLLSKSSGATVQHVNMKDIRALKIGEFPSIEIQNKLLDSLMDIQEKSKKLEAIYQRKLEALAELKQSILQKAFTGQLTTDKAKELR